MPSTRVAAVPTVDPRESMSEVAMDWRCSSAQLNEYGEQPRRRDPEYMGQGAQVSVQRVL